jgi:signal transduction histidine kinase
MSTTMDADTLQAVRQMPLFADLAEDQLGCIEPGEIIELPAGAVLAEEGQAPGFFYVALSGEIQFWRTYDRQAVLMAASKPGDFMGEMPILLDGPWMATARVSKPVRLFRLNTEGFWHMLATCPSVTRKVLSTAATRFRNIEGFASQREKLISLGTMAAGLAHELNNPASAALRAASELQEATDRIQCSLCELVHELETSHWEHLLAESEQALEGVTKAPRLDSITRSDREEVFGKWLEDHQIPESWELASTFVEAGLDVPWLEHLAGKLPAASRPTAIRWVEARLSLKLLLHNITNSTSRVSELVKAVKSYTHMDKTPMQEIDIHEGLESTLTMLGHKLKNVTVRRAFDRSLPRITAYAGELNQVWTNLIDNAIDAVNGTGKICVGTCRDGDQVVVEIVDNGVGIPANIQPHMFEPFFTTKPVGSGTGLGLVISNRIVADRHGGEIEFQSKPGETQFKVRLPIHGPVLNVPPAG